MSEFDRILLLGGHARAALKKIASVSGRQEFITRAAGSPPEITKDAVFEGKGSVVVGMGNIAGLGRTMVQYWDTIGESCEL